MQRLALTVVIPLTAPVVWMRDQVRLRYASGPVRVNAYFIDVALSYLGPFMVLFAVPLGFRFIGVEPMGFYLRWKGDNNWPFLLVAGAGMLVTVAYTTWWFSLIGRGQTPGKYLMKIRVVDAITGAPLTRRRNVRKGVHSQGGVDGIPLGIAELPRDRSTDSIP